MMIAAGGNERRLLAKALRQFKTEHAAIKRQRPIEIGNLQMDVANADARIDRRDKSRALRGNFRLHGHHPLLQARIFC